MSLIDVTLIDGDPDTGTTRAGCVQTDEIRLAYAISPRGTEARFVVEFLDGRKICCTGNPQSVLTP